MDRKTEPKEIISNDKQSLESLMLSNINLKAMMFYIAVCNSKAFPPLGELTSNIDNYLNIFITTGDIEPIQQFTIQTLREVNIDKLDRMFRAHVNLRLSSLYLAQNDYKKALRYYDRGITYSNIKDFDDLKDDISTYINKERGIKGGAQKGINYSEPKQKALDYHDKYLNAKNDKGKHVYSNDKAAREIIAYFESKSVHLGYAERSLSNIISKHRNGQTKG